MKGFHHGDTEVTENRLQRLVLLRALRVSVVIFLTRK